MLTESLNIYVIDKDGNKVTFPNVEGMQPAIVDVNLNRERMAGAPTNTSTLMYPVCLDSYWTKKEFIEIGSERYYVKQVPTSEKNTEDARYKHEITFVSERDILENVFFFDCVTQDTSSQISDKPRSNTTDFSFYGDLNELVQRLNDSLSYSKIYDPKGENGFCIVIDDDVEIGEAKEVSMTDAYFATAMQEIYNVFEVPYYWVGKICHVGYQENEITEPFEYGSGNGLISVQKTNAEFRLINRITGQGSADNIPYYYPNTDPNGIPVTEYKNMQESDISGVVPTKIANLVGGIIGKRIYFGEIQKGNGTVLINEQKQYAKKETWQISKDDQDVGYDVVERNYSPGFEKYEISFYANTGDKIDLTKATFEYKVTISSDYNVTCNPTPNKTSVENWSDTVNADIFVIEPDNNEWRITTNDLTYTCVKNGLHKLTIHCNPIYDYINCHVDFPEGLDVIPVVATFGFTLAGSIYLTTEEGNVVVCDNVIYPEKKIPFNVSNWGALRLLNIAPAFDANKGIVVKELLQGYDYSSCSQFCILDIKKTNIMSKLMPSIYRETEGTERFYNAKNETYKDDNGVFYSFNNPYVPSEPLEGKQDFEDIKPTINGITNENGELFGEIAEVAFDDTDSDDLSIEDAKDANTNTAKPVHPYFYVKLHRFSGVNGFNLFKQGLAQGAMTFNFITGSCAGCSFKVKVSEGKQVDNHYEFKNEVQVDEQGNIVAGDSGDKINASNPIASQQDTMTNSVWIALEKDNSTFGVLMPNATNNYRPQGKTELKEGDKFVITNILLPIQYITAAEKRLDAALVKYMSENNDEKFTFSIKFSRIYLQEHPEIAEKINENTKLHVKYNNVDYPLFVSSYSRKSDDNILDEISVELSEKLTIAQNKSKEQMDSIMGNVNEQINNAINGSNGGGSTISAADINEIKTSLKYKLSRVSDDTANGKITFQSGANFGAFTSGTLGTGGNIDYRGNAELDSLFIRRFLSVPKFVFNQVNVTASEQWNTNAYGTIESVDTWKQQITLRLESNEYGLLMVGDICRGIFADIENAYGSDKNEEGSLDDCGFTIHRGFFTTYFYVKRIITNQRGKFVFEYGKRSDVTPDPCTFMDFAQYGNFTDESRQSSMYFSSRGKTYTEVLDGVKTWDIQPANRAARFGWLGNLTLEKKDGTTINLKDGNGLYVQKNIYFGGTVEHLDGLKELEDLKELASSYDVSLSQYQSVITVDDMGNVINGLYAEDEAKTTKQYRISTAVFVRKGTQILLEEDAENENVTEGHYRLHVVSDDCDVEVRNSTVFVKGIRNIKDGVSGTEDDATFDYEAMRRTTDAMVMIVVDLEGKTSKTVQMPIRIQHDSLPFMVCDISNENASVAWNTKTKKYLGLPIKATVNLMYHNEPWLISECKVVGGVPEGLTATVALNENRKSYDITINGNPADDTLPQVSNIIITVVGRYAGANYEYTKTLTISKSADNVIYEIVPSADSIVIDKNDNMTADILTCDIYATSSDDKRYKLTALPEGFALKYGIDTDVPTTAMSINGTVNVSSGNNQVVFALYDKSGNILDKESVPLLAYGKDGKGIEYVFKRTTDDEIPSISFPDKWETDPSYQQDDYVPSGWTDDPVGVNEQYLYEWVATRKSVNGVWQPFGEVSEYAHFGKHAPRAIVSDDIVTIPTDSAGNTLTDFSEIINFSMLVNGSAATVNLVSRTSSLPSGVSCTVNERSIGISVKAGTSLGTKAYTLNFDVCGSLNNASYKDSVSIKVVPNVTGEDGDGYEYVYYLSATEQTPETPSRSGGTLTSGWTEDVPALTETQRYVYVAWKRGEVGADGEFSAPKLFTYKAKDGEDGNSVSDIKNYYRANTSPTAAPTSGWKASASESGFSSTNKYLWNYEEVFYSKTGSTKTTPRVIAVWGEKGNTGISVTGIEEQYALSTSNTTVTGSWSSSIPTLTATNKYLWNRERTKFDDGTYSAWSTPVIIGVYGDKGVGEVTAYCRSAITPTIAPTVTSRDAFVNANPSANLGASLTHDNPANGNSIFTDGWDSIKSAATLNSFWRKAIPDAAVLNNVKANVDNSGGYWENFTLDGYGWWKSPKTEHSATSMMKIKFTTTQANQVVTFVIRASSEENYDFGIIGKLDTEGVSSYTAKVSGSNEIYIPILVPIADNHHIWVAYTKDVSRSPAPDCCYVRIATDELHQIKGIADGETIKWETISEIKATKGDTGYGCVMRTSLWAAGKEYVNQSNEQGDGVKYIDIVYVEDSSANEGYRLYECRVSHTSSTTLTYNDTNHWRRFADFNPIYTPLIVAKNAVFKFAQGQQFNIADGDTVWGSFRHVSNSDDLALWLGAKSGADGSTASFSVTKGGKLTATNAVIKGEITATKGTFNNCDIKDTCTITKIDAVKGTIAGLQIADSSISATTSAGTMNLTSNGLNLTKGNYYARIGTWSYYDAISGTTKTIPNIAVGGVNSSGGLVDVFMATSDGVSITTAHLKLLGLPKSSSGLNIGEVYNDNGTLKIK